jgi:hypothetical protein
VREEEAANTPRASNFHSPKYPSRTTGTFFKKTRKEAKRLLTNAFEALPLQAGAVVYIQ